MTVGKRSATTTSQNTPLRPATQRSQQDTARRENDAERGPPAPPFVLGCCHGVEWPAPDHLEPDGQQAQPEEVGRRLA